MHQLNERYLPVADKSDVVIVMLVVSVEMVVLVVSVSASVVSLRALLLVVARLLEGSSVVEAAGQGCCGDEQEDVSNGMDVNLFKMVADDIFPGSMLCSSDI